MIIALKNKLLGLNSKLVAGTSNEPFRRNWLKEILLKVPAGSRILDAGAGEQQFKSFCAHLEYFSQDFAAYDPGNLEVGLQVNKWDYGKLDIVSDIASIPVDNASFDAVMCTEVFEHIINPREAVSEFSRILKSNGHLIITAPFCSMTHFAPYHFYTGFNRFFYEKELSDKGFEILEITENGNYFEFMAQEIRRLPEMNKKYASDIKLSKLERMASLVLVNLLQKLSAKDKDSKELLCFGLQIHARKK